MISTNILQSGLNKPQFKQYQSLKFGRKVVYAQQVATQNFERKQSTQLQPQISLKQERKEEENPGISDSKYFVEDENVVFWRNFIFEASADGPNLDSAEGLNNLREAFFQAFVSARVFRDETSVRYWSYHIARTAFFFALTAAGLIANSVINSNSPSPRFSMLQESSIGAVAKLLIFGPPADAMVAYNQDLKNIQKGLYKLPWDMTTPQHHQYNPLFVLQNSIEQVQDSVKLLTRNINQDQQPLWLQNTNLYPKYYQNTFHYQTDGWMSSASARIYETQTEAIFFGRQDVMQRHTLVPIHNYLKDKNQRNMRALEVAAGTGRFATFFKDNYPGIHLTVSDLSPYYLEKARENIEEWKNLRAQDSKVQVAGVDFVQAAAENLPFEDNSFDIVYCVYLFHEIPYEVRVKAIKEFSRVLSPGGILVLTDSYQLGDRLGLDMVIDAFESFNEPWYGSYIKTNFGAIFEEANLVCDQKVVCSNTKVLSAIKPKN